MKYSCRNSQLSMMQDYTHYVNIALRDTKDNTTQLNSHTHFLSKLYM